MLDANEYFKKGDIDKDAFRRYFDAPRRVVQQEEKHKKAIAMIKKFEFSSKDQADRGLVTRVMYTDAVDPDSPRNAQHTEVILVVRQLLISVCPSGGTD